MIWTIKLLLIVGATATYADNTSSVRQNTSYTNVTNNSNTIEVAEGVKISSVTSLLDKSLHNDLTSTPVVPSSNVPTNITQIANSNSGSFNSTSSTSSTSTTSTTTTTIAPKEPPPKLLINYDFSVNKTSTAIANATTTTTEKIIPVNEFEMGEKNDHKMSVAKKGFQMNETGELFSSATTTTPRHKKPTVTIGNDDTADIINNGAIRKSTNGNMNSPNARKTDYIVPIVGVILSVPLVAILLNLMYRKTKDWWQYRHYKRMDLIDGIYNN